MRIFAAFSSVLLFTIIALGQEGAGYKPKAGYVPDSKTAIKIAETVLTPIYGSKKIESERPFTATLEDGVWKVAGTLRCPDEKGGITTRCFGGVAIVRRSKSDGRILNMMHGK